ncbi:anti-sigma regulatory factor [Nocardioides lentus]|uniref:Anti-sigma regulatory factor n=1 Tax=Nocardioides lentus TaxID=338077 RepID=A0ABP5B4T0_9ACTN
MTHTGSPLPGTTLTEGGRPDVELRLPADGAYVSVLRTAAAGLAARLDFTIDDIEDLRMAVSEACALLLPSALPGSDLHAAFVLSAAEVRTSISVDTAHPEAPDRDGFAWQVLSALATSADAWVDRDRVTVALTITSTATG